MSLQYGIKFYWMMFGLQQSPRFEIAETTCRKFGKNLNCNLTRNMAEDFPTNVPEKDLELVIFADSPIGKPMSVHSLKSSSFGVLLWFQRVQ
jgi:hypothetical protein